MMNEAERDRQLIENLDRVLHEGESGVRGNLDDDARTALEFARKMASLREKPTKEFAADLKAQLIHQLAEQERKERSRDRSFLLWETQHRTMWQWTTAAIIALIITGVILVVTVLMNRPG